MGTGLTKQEELKVENSRQITNVALVLLPAVAVVVGVVLDSRVVGGAFWLLTLLASAMLASSILLGGLGISRVRRGRSNGLSLFNLQAVLCLLGFLSLAVSYFAVGRPTQTNVEQRIDSLSRGLGAAEERIKLATAAADADQRLLREEIRVIKGEVAELREQFNRVRRNPK